MSATDSAVSGTGQAASKGEHAANEPRIRRRNRVIASCLSCRSRKLKCDKLSPCSNCQKFRRDCLYIAPALDSATQRKLANIKDKLGYLEESLGRDVARRSTSADLGSRDPNLGPHDEDEVDEAADLQEPEDAKGLEPTPLAVFDQFYEEDADDELMDLGIALGKMRISDRIGGMVRPKMANELSASLSGTGHAGGTAQKDVFQRSYSQSRPTSIWQNTASNPVTFIAPGPDYIAPASGFFFAGASTSALADFPPPRGISDRLITQYLIAVHPIVRLVHGPSFERQYHYFWNCINAGSSPPPPNQAIMAAAMFSGAVSLADDAALQLTGLSKAALVDQLRASTELSLSRANFLQSSKVDTLQAFVMYLLPLCRNEISRAHSALTGTAIRLAQCIGLHKDGSLYGLSAVDVHVRRLIWAQLCFLDVRTCEATGPRPQIRKEDYDTKLPLNVNDEDLMAVNPPSQDSPAWTDSTLSNMKFEYYDFIRQLWVDMPRIDQKKITLTALLGKVQSFRTSIEAKYAPMVRENTPAQRACKLVYGMLSNRCFVIVLQRYAVLPAHPLPPRLQQMLTQTCMGAVEAGMAFDTQPDVKPWAWYRGALLQYHAALLLLLQVKAKPDMQEAERIWKCLDYVFELRPELSPESKGEGVILELRDRLELYHKVRKTKATTEIERNEVVRSLEKSGVSYFSALPSPARPYRPPMEATYPVAPPPQYAMPVAVRNNSQSSNSTAGPDVMMDSTMQAVTDIDWNEWDQYFPANVADFGNNMGGGTWDLSDVNLSFNPHTGYVRPGQSR